MTSPFPRPASNLELTIVRSYGPVEPTTKTASNVCGTIHPEDPDDYVNMQFRYVSEETLVALGYKPAGKNAAASRAPAVPATAAKTSTSTRPAGAGSTSAAPASKRKETHDGHAGSHRNGPSVRNVPSNRDGASSSSKQRQREEMEVESVDDELDQDHDHGVATAVKETKVRPLPFTRV